VYSGVPEMLVLEERTGERQWYSEVKSTDAKRDLPAEALLPRRMILQFDEAGLHTLVTPEYMASILDAEAVRRSSNVGVVEKDEHSER